jgi:hypothetical protein
MNQEKSKYDLWQRHVLKENYMAIFLIQIHLAKRFFQLSLEQNMHI